MKKAEIVKRIEQIAQEIENVELTQLLSELNKKEVKTKKHYYVHVRERVLEANVKYPYQMIELHKILEEQEKETMELAEIKELMAENAERLKTKQDPYRIYAYYQARMENEGWIERESERLEVAE